MDVLKEDEVNARLQKLPGWERKGEAISKTFEMSDFIHAVGFVVEVGMIAEGVWHHPDITIRGWNKVEITCSSHDAGTVTKRDLDLADKIEEALAKR
jgi:4a-hydroxytetrahydrobiopterin dehydratase